MESDALRNVSVVWERESYDVFFVFAEVLFGCNLRTANMHASQQNRFVQLLQMRWAADQIFQEFLQTSGEKMIKNQNAFVGSSPSCVAQIFSHF